MNEYKLNDLQQQWVDALRSGKYNQSVCELQGEKGFCCLGVACDIVDKNGITVRRNKANGFIDGGNLLDQPQEVQQAIGLINEDGWHMKGDISLVRLNDSRGYTFEDIADFIEENMVYLFTKESLVKV